MEINRLFFVLFFVASMAHAQTLLIATRGEPATHTIIRPADASQSQVYAAEEFQRFTEEMTGVKLAIATDEGPLPERAVLLGETRHTVALLGAQPDVHNLGADGFRLVVKQSHLLIVGGPDRGTLYGVYETLERYGGCRWYTSWH